MENVIAKIIFYMPLVMQTLGGLVIVATVLARFTPSPKDDSKIKMIGDNLFKILSYLPTMGINPNTQKLQEAYQQLVNEKLEKEIDA